MRPLLVCCLCMVWATGLLAQEPPAPAPGFSVEAAELQGIEHTRAREAAGLDAQEAACYQRFAVSGCLKEVQSRRRAMLAKQRREEATLHEQELAQRGAVQRLRSLQKAEEQQAQQAQRLADRADAGSAEQQQARKLQAQLDKQTDHAAQATRSAASSTTSMAVAAHTGGLTPAEAAAKRSSFARKQAQAQEKRQELARRLADKGGKSAAPLPLPQ